VVSGRRSTERGGQYLHRGLAARGFERRFSLADFVEVKGASLADGLLAIELAARGARGDAAAADRDRRRRGPGHAADRGPAGRLSRRDHDPEKAASFRNGVLTVTVAKRPEARRRVRRIPISG
jgi:HSP20 family molecular chaperone IbpA